MLKRMFIIGGVWTLLFCVQETTGEETVDCSVEANYGGAGTYCYYNNKYDSGTGSHQSGYFFCYNSYTCCPDQNEAQGCCYSGYVFS